MQHNLDKDLIIFTDGSSRGNPGPGGYAALVLYPKLDEAVELGGAKPQTTNNEMELTAIIAGLSYVMSNTEKIHIYTDSQYAMNGIESWMYGWQKNNWQKKNGDPIMHPRLWQQMFELVTERKKNRGEIVWHHVSGHVGIPANERVDQIANAFAEGKNFALYRGTLLQYPTAHILDIPSDAELVDIRADKKANNPKSATKNQKAYSYLSYLNNTLERHSTWAQCETRVRGTNAKFRKAISPEHEQEILKEWGLK